MLTSQEWKLIWDAVRHYYKETGGPELRDLAVKTYDLWQESLFQGGRHEREGAEKEPG